MSINKNNQQFKTEIAPLLARIKLLGFDIDNIDQLKDKNFIPLPTSISKEILIFLSEANNLSIRTLNALVRTLSLSKKITNTQVLQKLFEEKNIESEKEGRPYSSISWAIGNVFATVSTPDAQDWIIQTLTDSKWGKSREMLTYAVANNCKPDIAKKILTTNFDQFPGHAADALTKFPEKEILDFLKNKLSYTSVKSEPIWIRNELNKAIKKISQRLVS